MAAVLDTLFLFDLGEQVAAQQPLYAAAMQGYASGGAVLVFSTCSSLG
jgi:hypothetical protein